MKLMMAQLNPTVGDFEGNTRKIIQAIELAKRQNVEVVLFPELTLSGYPPEDLMLRADFLKAQDSHLEAIIKKTEGMLVLLGAITHSDSDFEKPLQNSCLVIENGTIRTSYHKHLLPTYDVFDERRFFEPGHGNCVLEYKGKRFGVIICEDIWEHSHLTGDTRYRCDPVSDLEGEKLDLLLNLSASPFYVGKSKKRIKVCCHAAKTLKCPVALCAQVGANDQIIFDGKSVLVNANGDLIKLGKGFEEDFIIWDMEEDLTPMVLEHNLLEELFQSLVLGVRDYCYKTNHLKVCIGLSGGVDSAVVAYIAKEALGAPNVTAVMMPSQYTSEQSVHDARHVAKVLGITLYEVPIEEVYDNYLKLLEPIFGEAPPDTTEGNLQTRLRGVLLMAISNKKGSLVLNTGNKSEMAMGYCTLYGDMCGSIGVLSDVYKKDVYALANYLNIPKAIIEKAPSAELKFGQKDSDTLLEYPILDTILEAFIEKNWTIEAICSAYSYEPGMVKGVIQRLFNNEYKRFQAPAGIRVSSKALGAGWRYPIVKVWEA